MKVIFKRDPKAFYWDWDYRKDQLIFLEEFPDNRIKFQNKDVFVNEVLEVNESQDQVEIIFK